METISPWKIYWVLQLDTIGMAAVLFSVFGGAIAFVASVVVFAEDIERWWLLAAATTLVWLLVVAVAVFLPSTKTAAAMFIIPAVANNQTIQRESGELYDLAKQALRNAADLPKNADAEADKAEAR